MRSTRRKSSNERLGDDDRLRNHEERLLRLDQQITNINTELTGASDRMTRIEDALTEILDKMTVGKVLSGDTESGFQMLPLEETPEEVRARHSQWWRLCWTTCLDMFC